MKWFAVFLFATPLAAQSLIDECNLCHVVQVADFKKHVHFAKQLSCEVCHGRSEQHTVTTGAVGPDRVASPSEVPALCGACHAQQLKEYTPSRHAKLIAARAKEKSANCGTCHSVHAQRPLDGIHTRCANCHTPLPKTCDPKPGCNSCHHPHTLAAKK